MGPTRRLVTIKRSGVDGAHFPLSLSSCLFGRSIECDIRIQLPVVSKQHCKIEVNDQEAILYNFSSTNPTQVNGSAIDEPVHLKHGDVITIIDRSFRYENERHQNGSKSAGFPGKTHEQEPAPRASRTSFSADADGTGEDSKAHSKTTAGSASRGPLVLVKRLVRDNSASDGSKDSAAQGPPEAHPSERVEHNGRESGEPTAEGSKEKSRARVSFGGDLKAFPPAQSLDNSKESESPFKKLYQSMKEEWDVKSQRQSVLQDRRKSGPQPDHTTGKEGKETQLVVSGRPRAKSAGSMHGKTAPPPKPDRSPAEALESGAGPAQPSQEAERSSIPLSLTTKTKASVCCSQQQEEEDLHVADGRQAANPGKSEGGAAAEKRVTPRKLLSRNQTPAKGEDASYPGEQLENLSSNNRSGPTLTEVQPTEIQNQPFLTQCLAQVERKIQKDSLSKAEKLAATAGQICSGLPGLSSIDINNFGDSINTSEGVSLKRRRVSFGGRLRPELFDENLPPNTPLKRGETPARRKSLATPTPTVLKKIIKEQPQSSGKEESSGICLEVTAQKVGLGATALGSRITPPGASDQRRRSVKAVAASGGGESPHQTDVPRRAGRRSCNLSSKRASISRSQHDILQMICSKRRSGASEANLIVAKSWADVVKLGAKQTQTKVVRQGPQRQMSKRARRPSTPKKPVGSVHNQVSTGHANSPCTIVIGKAQIGRVTVPARPYRMLNNIAINRKMDYGEDLSGLTELFKTPVKEVPQVTGTCSVTLSSSENVPGKQFQVTDSGGKPLPITSEILGENVSSSTRNAAKEPSDKCSPSPPLRRPSIRDGNTVKTPRNGCRTTPLGRKSPDSAPEPQRTASKLRRSRELQGAWMSPMERRNAGTGAGLPAGTPGRPPRETAWCEQEVQAEAQDKEKTLETCKEDATSKENLEMMAVRRPRTGVQKCVPTKDPSGSQVVLQTASCAKEPANEKERATKTPCRSSQPEARDPPESSKKWLKTPLWKEGVTDELSAQESLPHSLGESTCTREPLIDGKGSPVCKGAPKQNVGPVVLAPGMKRRTNTPKRKTQSLEDLTGFKELFQTPQPIGEPMTNGRSTLPCKSPQPALVDTPTRTRTRSNTPRRKADTTDELSTLREQTQTPGRALHTPSGPEDDRGSKALKEDAKQTLDSAASLPGSRRQRRAPQEKAQPLDDLAGLQELFQTPGRPRTPAGTKRQSKTSLGKVDMKEELSVPRSLTESPGEATPTPTVPDQEEKGMEASMETPKQKLEPTEKLSGLKRRPRTPKTKAQLLEDLAGLQELFQTPGRPRTPAGTKRQSKTSLGKVDVKEELSAPTNLTQSPGEATPTPMVPDQEEKGVEASMGTPKQKLEPTENLSGLKRWPRTPRAKAQLLEDLAGLQELFQTPGHVKDAVTVEETTEVPWKSPEPGHVRTPPGTKRWSKTSVGKPHVQTELSVLRKLPQISRETTHAPRAPEGDDKATGVSGPSAKRRLDAAENGTGSKRLRRAGQEKTQPPEDLAGFQELFQTPEHVKSSMTVDEPTEMPRGSPQSGLVRVPRSAKRQSKMSLGKIDGKEKLSVARRLKQSPRQALYSPTVPARREKGMNTCIGAPEQNLVSAEMVTGVTRQPWTPKDEVELLEDLAGCQELFQTPGNPEESVSGEETMEGPGKSPQPVPVDTPTVPKKRPSRRLGKVDVTDELSTLREPTHTPGGAPHTPRGPEDDRGSKAVKGSAKQTLDSAASLPGSKRQRRAPQEKAQPLDDLAGLQELFQTPGRPRTPAGTKRQSKTSLGKVDVKEEASAPGSLTQLPGEASHMPKVPDQEEKGMETPKRKLEATENLSGLKRRPRTPRAKAQLLEDPAGLEELFQTPGRPRTPPGTKRQSKTSLVKIDVKEELSAPRNLTQSPSKFTPTVPDQEEKGMETPKQKLEPTENLSGLKRWPRTPEAKVQLLEDPAGLQELFQTPGRSRNLTQSPGKATPMPTVPDQEEKGVETSMGTPKQKLEPTENLGGLKRRPRTLKAKAQLLEDLSGLQKLFQTPGHVKDAVTVEETTEVPWKSPEPGHVRTPPGTNRRSKTSAGKLRMEEDVALLRKPSPPRETVCTPMVLQGDIEDIEASKGSAKRKRDPAASVTGRRRRPRPEEEAQPLEDLAGFQELFLTPEHAKDTMTVETTELPREPPQAEQMDTPATSKRNRRTRVGKVPGEEELSALREPPQTSGETPYIRTVPEDGKDLRAFKQPAKRKRDPAESVPGSKRLRRVPQAKARLLEDQAGGQELFQTPEPAKDPVTIARTTEMPWKSPQPLESAAASRRQPGRRLRKADVKEESPAQRKPSGRAGEARTPQKDPVHDSDATRVPKRSARQQRGPAARAPASKRQLRVPRGKAEPPGPPAGFQGLLHKSGHSGDSVSYEETTTMSCKPPQPEPAATPAPSKRLLRTRLGKVVVKEEPSAQGKPSGTARVTRSTRREPTGDSKSDTEHKQRAKRKLDPTASVPGSKRPRGSPGEKALPLEDPAGSNQQVQAPGHTEESVGDEKLTEMPSVSLQPDQVDPRPASEGPRRTRLREVSRRDAPSAGKKVTRASRPTTVDVKAPEGAGRAGRALRGSAQQTLDPTAPVTRSRRRPRAEAEAQPSEDPAGSPDTVQTPGQDAVSRTDTPEQTPAEKPLRAGRRVRGAPKEKPTEVQAGPRDLTVSQSNAFLSPKRKSGAEGRGSGTRGLRSVASLQEAADKKPVPRKQRAAPNEGHLSPEPLKRKKILTNRAEPVEEQQSSSRKAAEREPKLKDMATPQQKMSLRSRHQKKTDTEQPSSEFPVPAEKIKRTRQEKSVKASGEVEQHSPADKAQKPTPKVRGNKTCLRAGAPSRTSPSQTAEEKGREKSVEVPVEDQKEEGVAGKADGRRLRSRKTGGQPRGKALDNKPELRVTRGTKKCAEDPQKDKDIVCTKKLRTRSPRNSEDIL